MLGCRQVGKTTIAHEVQRSYKKPSVYLDLELPEDRAQLSEPQLFLEKQAGKLLILDEIQRIPELFVVMRGIIDRRKRAGENNGQYLILGSANQVLLKQSSESLAGRISYLELNPFNLIEAKTAGFDDYIDKLWVRGGFPSSFLAQNNAASFDWRTDFIRTYLERDLMQLSPQLSTERIRILWTMLAFDQGNMLNVSRLSSALGIAVNTIKHYVEILADLFLIRLLRPWAGHSKKRLIKSPKVYVRDSGLVHALTQLRSIETLTSHPICGTSWEGFVIEQLLQVVPRTTESSFYRTRAGAEIDLILTLPDSKVIAVEIKRTIDPKISKGFHMGCEDINPTHRFYCMPRGKAFPLDNKTQAIGLEELIVTILSLGQP